MKIVFTGGGTGGHFYPLIAVAEELNSLIDDQHIAGAQFYYFADEPYDKQILFERGIEFYEVNGGKLRLYPSLKNLTDIFKTVQGIFQALIGLYKVFPDVVFSKGGYVSFPTLLAARVLGIPVVIHESDSVPGRVHVWAGKFAKRIAVSYPEAVTMFPEDTTAYTGQPIRKSVARPTEHGSREYLRLQEDVPTLFILGGSQGSQKINELVLEALPELLERYQVIHQVGEANADLYGKEVDVALGKSQYKSRYKMFGHLNSLAMSMSAGIASLVISRAGSTIFEIANWGLPSIIIPIPEKTSRDQKTNAYNYARNGACTVMEEENLGPQLFLFEINRILSHTEIYQGMQQSAKAFARDDAARKIAQEILSIGLEHEE